MALVQWIWCSSHCTGECRFSILNTALLQWAREGCSPWRALRPRSVCSLVWPHASRGFWTWFSPGSPSWAQRTAHYQSAQLAIPSAACVFLCPPWLIWHTRHPKTPHAHTHTRPRARTHTLPKLWNQKVPRDPAGPYMNITLPKESTNKVNWLEKYFN